MATFWRLPDGSCVQLACAPASEDNPPVDDVEEAARLYPKAVQVDQPTYLAYLAGLPPVAVDPASAQGQINTLKAQVAALQATIKPSAVGG